MTTDIANQLAIENEQLKQAEQPSLRPWTLGRNGDKCAKNHAICSGSNVIAKVYGKGYPIGEGWSPQSEADAQLIVTAVNNFDALVAVLEDELEALRVWLSNKRNAKLDVIEGMLISRQKITDVLRQVRA